MFAGLLTSVLVPIVTDFFKGAAPAISRKVFGVSVDDQLKIEEAAVKRLQALAELDNPHGTPSQWVIDLRAAFRYVAAAILIIAGVSTAVFGLVSHAPEIVIAGLEMAGYPFGFIFGERLVLSYRPQGK